jgi:hypothetical protein
MGIRESVIRKKFKGVKFQRIAFGTVLLVKGTTNAQYNQLKKAEDKLAEIFNVEIVNFI